MNAMRIWYYITRKGFRHGWHKYDKGFWGYLQSLLKLIRQQKMQPKKYKFPKDKKITIRIIQPELPKMLKGQSTFVCLKKTYNKPCPICELLKNQNND